MVAYPAKIYKQEGSWLVEIDELGVYTFGESLEHAKQMAKEALDLRLEDEEEIAPPSTRMGKEDIYLIEASKHVALAIKLKDFRKDKGFTQSEMADKLGIKYQAYQKLENSKVANPTIKRIEKIEKVLGRELVTV